MLIKNKNETLEVVSMKTKGYHSTPCMVVKHHRLGSQPKFYAVPLYELSEAELTELLKDQTA